MPDAQIYGQTPIPPPLPEASVPPYTNGVAPSHPSVVHGHVDPSLLLLVEEVRRSNDALRGEMVGAQKETTKAIKELRVEVADSRKSSWRLTVGLSAGLLVVVLVALFGLLSVVGADVGEVADAVKTVTPATP